MSYRRACRNVRIQPDFAEKGVAFTMIEAAIYGYGNIGSGVAEVIEKNQERIERAIGEGVHVKYVLDLREFEGDPVREVLVHDVDIIVNDPEVKIIWAETSLPTLLRRKR